MSDDEDNYAARAVKRGEEGWPPAGELAPERSLKGMFERGPEGDAALLEVHKKSSGFVDGECTACGRREDQYHLAGCMNLGPAEAFAEGLSIVRAALGKLPKTRERSLVETKLDEAELWFPRAIKRPVVW